LIVCPGLATQRERAVSLYHVGQRSAVLEMIKGTAVRHATSTVVCTRDPYRKALGKVSEVVILSICVLTAETLLAAFEELTTEKDHFEAFQFCDIVIKLDLIRGRAAILTELKTSRIFAIDFSNTPCVEQPQRHDFTGSDSAVVMPSRLVPRFRAHARPVGTRIVLSFFQLCSSPRSLTKCCDLWPVECRGNNLVDAQSGSDTRPRTHGIAEQWRATIFLNLLANATCLQSSHVVLVTA
jgi:hypothetical protein